MSIFIYLPPQNVKGKLSQFSQAKIEKILAINLAQIHDMLGLEYPELTIENAQNAIDKISWLLERSFDAL